MKRIITFLVLLFGVLSSLMAHDAVVDGIYYNLDTDNKTAWVTFRGTSYSEYLDEYSGNVEIPETIVYKDELYSVIFITNDAFHFCKNLTSVVIGNNVTSIKDWAFSGCSALSSVTIGSAVTSISDYAFNECRILDDIVIPENVTHIGNYAFRECDKLSSINIPNSGYNASFNGIFYGCENLKEVILPSKMTGIGQYVFSGCSALTSITLSENIKSIGSYAFAGCTGITSVTLPKSVNTIGANAFENCTGLKTLQIGSGVTSIGENAFNGCSSLESVTSYATTVPTVATSSFENYNAYLYVPCASKIDYDLDATFGQFKYIECVTEEEGGDDNGNDDTGGDDTSDDNTNDDNTDDTVTPTVFDTTTDQGVAFVVNPNSANPVYVPLTYSYNAEYQTAQYTGTYTVTDLDFTAKIGGLTNFDVINYGTNGQALQTNYSYNPTRGASNGFTITGDYKVGDILNISATFGSDWYVTLIVNVTKTLEPTPNDITLYYVNSDKWAAVNGYVWPTGGAGLLDWPGAPATKTDQTVDGYDVYSYTFDATKADNIIFNNGSGGDGNQTSDLAVDASKPYYYNGVWYASLTFDDEGGDDAGEEGGSEGGDDSGDVIVGEKADMYLVGQFSSWAFSTNYQFTQIDEDDFVLEFAQGSELQLEGQFKIASNGWSGSYDFGGNHSVDIDTDYVLTVKGANLNTAKVITVSKIAFNTTTATIRFSGVSTAKVFDVTKDYGLYLNADYTDNPFTFKGNGVYEASYTFAENSSYQFNVGDANYSSIELGAINLSDVIAFGTPYQLGETNYRLLTPVCEAGTELLFTLTITSDWTATILVTQKTTDEGGDDTPVDVDYIYIINTPTMGLEKITKYYSNTQRTGSAKQPVVISEKVAGYDVYRFEIDADATGIKWFTPDCSSELGCAAFGVSQFERTTPYYANRIWYESLEAANTWFVQFSGCDYVGCYPIREVQSGIYELKLEKITQSCSYRYVAGDCGNEVRAITKSDDPYDYFDLEIPNDGGTYTATLTLNTNNWTQSLSVVKEGGEEGGEEGGDDTGDVEIGEPANLYIIGALTGWNADATWQFSTADDEYFVLSFPKGQEQELSGQFKVASSNWSPYNYGAPLDLGSVEAGKEYVLEYNVATNLSIANIIKVSKIEFTLSTQTLKITGDTEEKVFDTTSDYSFYLYADYKDYPFTFKGNGVYEYDYTGVGPSSTIGDYQYKTVEWGRNSTGNEVTLGELYQLGLSNHPISFPDATTGQTLTIVLTVSSDWSATILVKDKSSEEGGEEGGDDPIVPETPAYVVRGNGGSDATGIWCGGIEWTADDSPVNNMADADKDGIYEVTYKNVPAGTWNFKVVGATEGWMGSDFLDTENSSAGYTTAPYDGNIGFTLNAPADVTIQFNTLTGKIIATTPSGSFGTIQIDHFHITLGSDDVCLDEYEFTAANNYKFTFTEDIVVDPAYGYTDVYYRIIGNCNYAVYEKHVGVNIAESGTYTLTVQFNGDYDNPEFTVTAVKQGGSDQPVVPDPVISAIVVPTFPQVEVGKTATATLTYTLENATKATATVDAPFYILSQSVNNGVGNVEILFMPETSGTYNGTLIITSGKTTQSAAISAVAVDPIPEVEASIKDLQVPAFANTYVNEASAVVATYTLENATEATASISGTGAGSFYIIQQGVTDNAGTVRIVFMPQTSGKHNATLTITSGKVSQSIDFSATAMEYVPEPEVAISNVVVPVFATVEQGRTANVTATFTLENATEFDATLSGEGADAFIITNKTLNNTQGSVKIVFIPSTAGTYQATLTLSAGKASHSVNFSAVATAPKPVVSITDINVPTFEEIYVNAFSAVTVTYTLVNATNATATMEKEDAFYVQNNKVTNGKGVAQVIFYPATAGVHHDVLIIEADGVSVRVDLSAVAKVENPTEPDAPISISNLQVPAFESITAKQTTTVIASYVLTGTTQATATISGNSAFSIVSQSVSEGVGRVEIEFAPTKAGKCDATLTVTAEGTTESIDFSATALPAPAITNLNVPAFEDVYVGDTRSVLATYTIENATEATATLLGDAAFTISNQSVYNGSGIARIDFAPTAEGTYNAVLVITSGVTQTTISFSATAVAEPAPEPEVVISNLVVPAFDEVYAGESVLVMATYTLENATEATATLSGDEAFSIVRSLIGSVLIQFAPTEAGTYSATLTIASGKVSESINFSATAMDKEDTELLPVISNLVVPAFAELYEGETVLVMATYTLENATEATATLSGDEEFSIVRSLKGSVLIQFAPTEAGTYSGTLTITSGKVSESIDFTAIAAELDQPVNPGDPEKPEDPDTPVVPDPLPEYPVRGYMYVVNTPDAHLERMVKYKPVSIDKVDYFLAPEKTGQKIYGYDIYKFEVRDEEMIDLWEYPNAQYTSWHIDVNVDLSATPYLANGVWYASIEEMMTWYVRYIPQWDDEASEKMIVESPNVYVATFDAFAESDDNDKYYYCLGNVEDPILEVGVSEYGVIQNYLQIPQGFKAMIYLDDTNWETAWNTYYKLVPPGDGWDKQYVDLGLTSGLCWATQNIGATEPQEEGTHFAWGEVEPKEDYSYNTYRWANLLKNNEYIKYVTDDWYGLIDFRTTLEPDDDAANVALEGKWHIPTQADVEELLRECTTEFGSYYGVNGYFVTGPNGNAIFLPAVGIKEGTGYEASTRGGDYWTSSLYENNQGYAVTLSFSLTYIDIDDMKRTTGLAIRPVIHKDYVGVEEVQSINVYAKDNTIYCEEPFEIYNVTGLNVTHLNGYLEGVYVVKTEKGNRLISVW